MKPSIEISKNGIPIIAERIKWAKSVSIGILVKSSVIAEDKTTNGYSHFIEHMLFKGTANRNAYDIATSIDKTGGNISAYTAKEYTLYYATVPGEYANIAIDILQDMINNPRFDSNDIKNEKGVIEDEILMYQDSGDDIIFDNIFSILFKESTLGLPIIGTKNNIKKITKDKLLNFYKQIYNPKNIIISVAGNFKLRDIIKLLSKITGNKSSNNEVNYDSEKTIKKNYSSKIIKRDFGQTYIGIATDSYSRQNKKLIPTFIFNNIIGGNISSRLSQRIREKKGYCYSIYSFYTPFIHTGSLGIYFSSVPSKSINILEEIKDEIKDVVKNGIKEEEVNNAKMQLKGSLKLTSEIIENIMLRNLKNTLFYGRYISIKEIINDIEKTSLETINKIARETFNKRFVCIAVGNNNNKTLKTILKEISKNGLTK